MSPASDLTGEAESALAGLGPEERRMIEPAFRHLEKRIAFLESKNQRAARDRAAVHTLLTKTSESLIRKYQTIFEYSGTAMVVLENDGTISLANSNWEKLLGYTPDEVQNRRKFSDFFEEESRKHLLDYHRKLVTGNRSSAGAVAPSQLLTARVE